MVGDGEQSKVRAVCVWRKLGWITAVDAKAAGIIVLALRCSAEWRLPFAKWQCIGLWPTFPSFIAAGAKAIAISTYAATDRELPI